MFLINIEEIYQQMRFSWLFLLGLLIILFLINVSLGSVRIPLSEILDILLGGKASNPAWTEILVSFRLPKACTSALAGGALALSGLMMQTLFRNPLAGPDVLGLSSGASLMVAVLVMAGNVVLLPVGPYAILIAASAGCGVIFLIMIGVANRIKDHATLLIIGLMVGAGTSSIVSVLQFLSRAEEQQYFLVWTFGSMGGLNWNEILILSGVTMSGIILAIISLKAMNAWLLGDNYAKSLGVNLRNARMLIIICTSLLTGSVTAFCGPIAFVGLAVPHLVRSLLATSDHKILIPGVLITGASLMLFCDSIAQLPGSAFVLPINAITALIGAPVVIWVIVRARKIRV